MTAHDDDTLIYEGNRIGIIVGCLALALFAPTALLLSAPPTYLSAARVAAGEVLYRDIWTMYAPGSIYAMALVFRVFGTHLVIGNVLGVLVSASAVFALYRLALRVVKPLAGAAVALVFALAFLGAGYQNSLATYPPAILCVLAAASFLARHAQSGARRDLVVAGILLGLSVLFKHDVGGYACLAAAVSVFAVPRASHREALGLVALLAAVVVAVLAPPLLFLARAGAGPAMLTDLIVFPAGDFSIVRGEWFPLLPPWPEGGRLVWARRMAWWVILNWPTVALLSGCVGGVRSFRSASPDARRIVVFSLAAFVCFWSAAHVQANTHKITMAALGALVGAAGLFRFGTRGWKELGRARYAVALFLAIWAPALVAEQVARQVQRGLRSEFTGLPRLEGVLVPSGQAAELRALSVAIAEAAPPDAPLVVLGSRNDVMIAAGSLPYWVSERRIVTAHHELHPGVTDTEPVQRQMIDDLTTDPPPVVVLEHRFPDEVLDRVGADFRSRGVAVGSTLLDDWVAAHYTPGPRYGMNQVMYRSR